MRKLFSVLTLVLFASISVLSGCDLITLNETKYYETVVATIGDYEVTKFELISRFNSVGANFVQQGYSVEEAMEMTLNNIIDRHLIVSKAKEEQGEFSQAVKNEVWQEVYDSINNQLKEIEGQIKAEWGVITPPAEEPEDDAVVYDTYEEYEAPVEYVNGEFVKPARDEEPVEEPIGDFVRSSFNNGIPLEGEHGYQAIQEEAWARYIRQLKNAEEWKNLSTVTEDVFERELNRLYGVLEGNKYIEIFQDNYEYNLEVDNTAIVNKYIELVQDSFAKYSIDMDAYHSAMGSSPENVYWHPGDEYVYVSHILIGYTDEQKELIEQYDKDLEDGTIDQVTYDANMLNLQNAIAGKERNELGEEFGDPKLASTILNEIQTALAPLGNDVDAKAAVFNDFIYKYNTDPGMFNAKIPYVVNLDTEVTDKMVKPFADTARELYQIGEGSLSELVLTEFGYHIIYYSRPATNIISYDNLINITPEALYNTKLSAGLEKNMYHKMYELVNARGYSQYQTAVINQMKSDTEITLYESRYDDLYK